MDVMGSRKTGSYGVCLKLRGSLRRPAVIIEGFRFWDYCRNCASYTDWGLHRLPLHSLHPSRSQHFIIQNKKLPPLRCPFIFPIGLSYIGSSLFLLAWRMLGRTLTYFDAICILFVSWPWPLLRV